MLPEATSDPPQRTRECAVDLRFACSWLSSCFDGVFVQTSFQIRNRRAHGFRRGATWNNLRGNGIFNRRTLQKIFFKERRNLLHVSERQLRPRLSLTFCLVQHFSNQVVRLAERNTAVYEIIGGVGGEQCGIGSGSTQAASVEIGGKCRNH